MINKRNYLNQVALIDSECDTMRNQPMLSTNSFYRSPLRDRQNKMNLSNTPLRSGKASLSPLRQRKGDNQANNMSNTSVRTTKRKAAQQVVQNSCFNHPQKTAKFYVEAPDQVMYCCEKCAILLASQGFSVCKLQYPNLEDSSIMKRQRQSHPRKMQIQSFMSNLQNLSQTLHSIQGEMNQKFSASQSQLEQELSKIQAYYDQFYEILDEHKKRVILEMKEEFQKNNTHAVVLKNQLKQAIEETDSMKKDILESWDDIIFVAEEHQYRPVIKAYNEKLQSYKQLASQEQHLPELRVRKLNFINTDAACQALEKGLQVQWEDQQKQEQSIQTNQKKDSQIEDMARYSKQSELPQNPVQCVQKQEKFVKSSLKDLVGLFSSFEQ